MHRVLLTRQTRSRNPYLTHRMKLTFVAIVCLVVLIGVVTAAPVEKVRYVL